MKRILLLCGGIVLSSSSFAWAALTDISAMFTAPQTEQVGPGESVFLGTSTTGVFFENKSSFGGEVSIEFIPGPPGDPKDLVTPGFRLVDGTLRVTSNIPDGEKLVRIRIGYSEERLMRAGLRAGSERLFRRAFDGRTNRARWARAVRAIRARATIRRTRSSPIRELGRHGFDPVNKLVWGVLDVTSDYAVGARVVAEPASWFLIVGGLGLVLWSSRQKS